MTNSKQTIQEIAAALTAGSSITVDININVATLVEETSEVELPRNPDAIENMNNNDLLDMIIMEATNVAYLPFDENEVDVLERIKTYSRELRKRL